ncbi:hypothetical protein EMIT0196MI5_90159 [Pseudomonas sp. IT-196MI5]
MPGVRPLITSLVTCGGQTKGLHRCKPLFLNGAGTRNRTRDLLITSQLLYHLSYTGVSGRRL